MHEILHYEKLSSHYITVELVLSCSCLSFLIILALFYDYFYQNHLKETDIRLENTSSKDLFSHQDTIHFKFYFVDIGLSFKENTWLCILLLNSQLGNNSLCFIPALIGVKRSIGQQPAFHSSFSLKSRQNHGRFLLLHLLLLSRTAMTSAKYNQPWLAFILCSPGKHLAQDISPSL